jgi:glycosyltransferase involved in cell wall biosynthesis
MQEAYNFYLNELKKKKFTKLDFVNYEVRFEHNNLYLDKVCTALYKEYFSNTRDTKTNPLVDREFYDFLISIDDQTKFPVYIRKLYEMMPEIFIRLNKVVNYDNIIAFIKNDSFPYNGIVNLETIMQLRNNSIKRGYEIQYENNPIKANAELPHYPAVISFCKKGGTAKSRKFKKRKISFKSDRVEIIKNFTRICIPSMCKSETLPNLSAIKERYTEIWVPSAYCKDRLQKKSSKRKIKIVPYPVIKPKYKILNIDLPKNQCIIMLRHDFNLDFVNQNPLASLSAFQEAFSGKDDVRLICFLINVNKQSEDYKTLVTAFSNEKNAIIVEGKIDDNYYSYLHHAHCFISLHQETMFGYPLAEAMSIGKYVLATNNGGNTEYMNSDNSFLIDLTSERDLTFEAAKVLKSIYNDSNMLNTKSKQARLHIQKHLSPSSVGFIMQKRLEKKPSLLLRLYMKFKRIKQKKKNMKSIMNLLLKNADRPAVLE